MIFNMVYMGSKRRLAKDIVPILQGIIDRNKIEKYYEPFVGGANIIDKIKCPFRQGSDLNEYLVELLLARKYNFEFPERISEEEYKQVKNNKEKYSHWYAGAVGFFASFGAKFFNGYARSNTAKGLPRRHYEEILNNMMLQDLAGIDFKYGSFETINIEHGSLVYCDPPYAGTTGYKDKLDYEKFYVWCREIAKHSTVVISEYSMPDDFKVIKEWKLEVNFASQRKNSKINTEKLFTLN
jgi:site-specific DNA-adenine methylase